MVLLIGMVVVPTGRVEVLSGRWKDEWYSDSTDWYGGIVDWYGDSAN